MCVMVMKCPILETWAKQNRNDNLTELQDSRKETPLYLYPVNGDYKCSFYFQAARGGRCSEYMKERLEE